jgi:hypothetical protein
MPCALTRTLAPSFVLEAVFTTALEEPLWLVAAWALVSVLVVLLLELLPHAESSTEAMSVGIRSLMDLRTVGSSGWRDLAWLDSRAANPKDDAAAESFRPVATVRHASLPLPAPRA